MRKIILVIASLSIVLILGGVRPATAQFYTQHNLVSDGAVPADHPDPNMVNSTFAQVNGTLPPGAFTDPDLPPSYAPFGIQNLNGVIYVTYALQDALKHDDVPGKGHGFVNAYDTKGTLLRRVASEGKL